MEQQATGIFTNTKDKEQFDNWSKEQIYEAYLLEHRARSELGRRVVQLERRIAEIRYLAR